MRFPVLLPLLLGGAVMAVAQAPPDPQLLYRRNTYHPVTELLASQRVEVTAAQMDAFRKLPLEVIWATVRNLGYTNCHFSGLQSTRPNERLVGRALTIRYLPRRPDLVDSMTQLARQGDWPIGYHVRAAEEVKPGDVIVVDLGGGIEDGIFFGDISALAAKTAGAAGVVLYGGSRDLTELQAMEGFPVLAMGFDPMPATQIGVDWNTPIRVGKVTVLPGDVVVADTEAVLFFPASIAAEVAEKATEFARREDFERLKVRQKKHRFRDIYPLNSELEKEYQEWRKTNPQ